MNPRFPRARLLAAAVATGVLALTGCGSSDSGDDASPKADQPTTRTVQATNGSVSIPVQPKRIVAISYAAGALLDVGVTPIGTTKIEAPLELVPEQAEAGKKIAEIGAGDQVNLEKVAGLSPDLIIVEGADFGWPIDKLKGIAPTLYFEVAKPDDLLASAEKIADAVGKKAEFAKLKAAYDTRLAAVKTANPEALKKKFAIVNTYGDGKFLVATRTSWIGQVLNGLDAGFAKESDKTDTHENEYSQENISKLADADAILVARSGGAFSPEVKALTNESSWKLLKAAKTGQVHAIDFANADRVTTLTAVLTQIEKVLQGLK